MLKTQLFIINFHKAPVLGYQVHFPIFTDTIERLSDLSVYADSGNLSFRGKRYDETLKEGK